MIQWLVEHRVFWTCTAETSLNGGSCTYKKDGLLAAVKMEKQLLLNQKEIETTRGEMGEMIRTFAMNQTRRAVDCSTMNPMRQVFVMLESEMNLVEERFR